MRRLLTLVVCLSGALCVMGQTNGIRSIGNLAAWYSADSVHLTADNHVDILYDKSNNERHATQSTADKQPAWVESDEYINGQSTMYFDGNDFLVAVPNELFAQPNTVFVVWKTDVKRIMVSITGGNASQRNQLVASGTDMYMYCGKVLSSKTVSAPFNHSVVQAFFNGTTSFLSYNGDIIANGDVGQYPNKGVYIGAENGGSYGTVGNISELIFFDGAISSLDSLAVMKYLQNKYSGKQLSIDHRIHIDYGFAPVTYTADCDWAQSFLWDDGGITPTITINDNKSHKLTVTDKFGFKSTDSIFVEYPQISLPDKNTTICAGDTLVWDATLNGEYTYLWCDGTTESSLKISKAGEYWLTITDNEGYSWKSDVITVSVDSIKYNSVIEDQVSVCSGELISTNRNGNMSFLWNTGETQNSIVVTQSGKYWVRVTDSLGCSVTDTTFVSISGVAPQTEFSYGTIEAGVLTHFENRSQSGDGTSLNYVWNFGDGTASNNKNPVHIFNRTGQYKVSLTVTSESGCHSSFAEMVSVTTNSSLLVEAVSPVDSQAVYSNHVVFKWREVDGCSKYNLQIATDDKFDNIVTDTIVSSSSASVLLGNGKFFWRVKTDVGQFGSTKTLYVSSIGSIGNLAAWYSADSVHLTADNHVDILYDKSGNSRDAMQPTAGKQPTWVESDEYINGQPTLYFDGNDFLSAVPDELFAQPNTFFVVWKTERNNTGVCITGANSSQRNQLVASGTEIYLYCGKILSAKTLSAPFNHSIVQAVFSGTTSSLSYNGEKIIAGDVGQYQNKGVYIGAENGGSYGTVGNISEIVFFDGTISASDSAAVMEYLQGKYSGKQLIIDHTICVDYGFAPVTYTAECDWAQSFLWDDGTIGPEVVISDEKVHFLTVTDFLGFKSSDFVVVDYPKISQPNKFSTICAGDTLVWDASLNGPYTYLWSDGSTESSLEITATGEYWLTITDTAGYSWRSDVVTVNVDNFSTTARLAADTIVTCVGNNIYLQTGFEDAVSYQWSDGTTADHLQVRQAGVYSVVVSNRIGCIARDTAFFNVIGIAPIPDFTTGRLCATRNVEFTDMSQASGNSAVTSYLWNFGDGTSSVEQSPAHVYQHSGLYNMQLTIVSDNGCTNLLKRSLYIDSLPKADFAPEKCCSFSETQFIDLSSTSDSYISSWNWTLNGTTTVERNPQTTFTAHGDQMVKLVVETAHGCTDTLERPINVMQGPNVDFAYSAPCVNTDIYLTNKTQVAMALATSYVWTADDTTVFSTRKSPTIAFADTGSHRITLSARQAANGCTTVVSKIVDIKANPRPKIETDIICERQPALLRGLNLEPESKSSDWTWNIDTMPEVKGQTASPVFAKNGRHKIRLTIADVNGCTAFYDTTVSAGVTPVAAFRALSVRGPVPFDAEFTNTSQNAASYRWSFGDGQTSTDTDACHTYSVDGEYTVMLLAISGQCSDTAERVIRAITPNIDLAMLSASAETSGGQIVVEAIVANRSNFDIANVEIKWYDNLGHSITETIADTIKENKIMQYRFLSKVGEATPGRLQYICVAAEPPAQFASQPAADNSFCITFNGNKFALCEPQPNPARDNLLIGFILPADGDVTIDLFDGFGKQVGVLYRGPAQAGYNGVSVDLSRFPSGAYFYRISAAGKTKSHILIIQKT